MSTYWFNEIKNCKVLKEFDVVLDVINLLGWVVLKSDEKLNDDLNETLAKLYAIGKQIIRKGW